MEKRSKAHLTNNQRTIDKHNRPERKRVKRVGALSFLLSLFSFSLSLSRPFLTPRTTMSQGESAGITISGLTGETITRHPGSING